MGLVVSCGESSHPVDVSRVFEVKNSFDTGYRVSTKGPADIDPKMTAEPKDPQGVTFDPPGCDQLATEQTAIGDVLVERLPTGTTGKMATTSAAGKGNRFIAIAVEATKPVPLDTSVSDKCKHVDIKSSTAIKGVTVDSDSAIDVIDAPQIHGVQTIGRHYTSQVSARGKERSSESYIFAAYFGSTVVMVNAAPLTARGQAPGPVDVDRAKQLLSDAVAAVRS